MAKAVFNLVRDIVENSDHRDCRCRGNRVSFGLVIKANIAADDWNIKRQRRITQSLNALNELPHNFGAFGISIIQAIRYSRRPRPGASDITHRLTDGRYG